MKKRDIGQLEADARTIPIMPPSEVPGCLSGKILTKIADLHTNNPCIHLV